MTIRTIILAVAFLIPIAAGALALPGEALAGWGNEAWGVLVWGEPLQVPGLGLLGLTVLAIGLAGTTAWKL